MTPSPSLWSFRKIFRTNVDIHKNELGIFPVRKEICLNFGNVPRLCNNRGTFPQFRHISSPTNSRLGMSTFVWNIFLKPNSETHFAMQVLENRVRRHAPRIRRGTRNCAEISAVRLSRSTRVPTSLKPAVQRLQAPATVTAPNSTYCLTIAWIFHGVYVSVSSIQDLLCVMYAFLCVTALVCWCVCVFVYVFVCVF